MKKILLYILSASLIMSPKASYAYGEKGHGNLFELVALLYGFDLELAKQQASFDLGFDIVSIAAATNPITGGMADDLFHFANTNRPKQQTTKIKDKTVSNEFAAVANEVVHEMIGNEIPEVGNPGSLVLMNQGLSENDFVKYAVGTHRAMDLAGAHQGFWPNLKAFVLKYFGRTLPLLNISVGHLHEGTEPDRITFEKFKLVMHMLGGPLIAARERQLQSGGNGINTAWLEKLKAEGVDTINNDSMIEWITHNEVILKYLKNLNASTDARFQIELIDQTFEQLLALSSDKKVATEIIKNYRAEITEDSSKPAYDVLYEIIDQLWANKVLNEPTILKNINRPISTAKTLDALVFGKTAETIKLDKNNPIPGTRKYVINEILSRYFNNVVRFPWNYHNSDYLNKQLEHEKEKIEEDAIENVRYELFGIKSKFVDDPKSKYLSMVYAKFLTTVKNKHYGPRDLKYIILELCDAVLNTTVAPEGTRIYTLTTQDRLDIMRVVISTFFKRNRETAPGGWDFVSPEELPRALDELKQEYSGQEFISSQLIEKWNQRRDQVNDKYNNTKVQIGVYQKSAAFVHNLLSGSRSKSAAQACTEVFSK